MEINLAEYQEAFDEGETGKITLTVGDFIIHKDYDYQTVFNLFKVFYPYLILVPVSSGTDAYTKYGDRVSYVKQTDNPDPEVEVPVFELGETSERSQLGETVEYSATAEHSTSIGYALDATSLAAGNTIDVETGEVTYTMQWYGISTITATAQGTGGPKSATHQATTLQAD